MEQAKNIDDALIEESAQRYEEQPALHMTANALSRNAIPDISFVQASTVTDQFTFSLDIPTLPVTDQQSSGRCWIFAGLNVLREKVAKACKLESFELSQNYTAFWDKFEKINYFLESVIDRIDQDPDERTLCWILDTGIQDGGQWDMFVSLIEKYGVVPKSAMPESYQSEHTADMNRLINSKLRQSASRLQEMAKAGADLAALQAAKEEILISFYGFLCANFGTPPSTFDFEYRDKDKNYHVERDMTPLSFADKYLGEDVFEEYCSIINAPTDDKPFYQTYTVDYIGNVVGGHDVHYLNLPMDEVVSAILSQLKAGEIVWFGSDVSHFRDRKTGTWNDRAYDFSLAFGMDFYMTKGEMLRYRHSAMTHAMVITGVDLDETGAPLRWKIENSWGETPGDKGYYLMSQTWFERFVYQAVLNKKYLSKEQREMLNLPVRHLDPWDPMGTLALSN